MEQVIAAAPIRKSTMSMRANFVGQIPVVLVALLIFAVFSALLFKLGTPFPFSVILANSDFYLIGLSVVLTIDSIATLVRVRPRQPIAHLFKRYTDPPLIDRIIWNLPLLAVLTIFLPFFTLVKPLIPALNPYSWDATFIAWDEAIFREDAWSAMQPVLGHPILTSIFSILYHAWFLLVYPGSLFIFFSGKADTIRRRYFLCFILIWSVIGLGLAALFSSVGPAFMDPLMGDARFVPQMAYLNSVSETYPVLVLDVQKALLDGYVNAGPGHGIGISAMPSMHVAMAFMYYLAIRHVSPRASLYILAFCLLIWVASVHLAYHYMVDGAVAIVATAVLWQASKTLLAWWDKITVGEQRHEIPHGPAVRA